MYFNGTYEGPIYRPPSEAGSLLIQATTGCPHNKCTFCMVYKKGPPFRVRPVADITAEMERAALDLGSSVRTLFFPAGNTIAMPTADLAAVCLRARKLFPKLERITVYGSSGYIAMKGPEELRILRESGLTRIHVGLESGDDEVLRRIKKGSDAAEHIRAGLWAREAGIELSEYVMIGIGGKDRSLEHVEGTARVLNAVDPHFIRIRTFLPKAETLLLHQIRKGRFQVLNPHEALVETAGIIERLSVTSYVASDHYTNYVNVEGRMPADRDLMLGVVREALKQDEDTFRPVYVGTQ